MIDRHLSNSPQELAPTTRPELPRHVPQGFDGGVQFCKVGATEEALSWLAGLGEDLGIEIIECFEKKQCHCHKLP
jgi:hypothetical protein